MEIKLKVKSLLFTFLSLKSYFLLMNSYAKARFFGNKFMKHEYKREAELIGIDVIFRISRSSGFRLAIATCTILDRF